MAGEGKKAFVTVSFGTTFAAARKQCIESVETDLKQAFPGYDHYRAFTSDFVRRKMAQTEGVQTDSLEELLSKLHTAGYFEVLLQVTHVTAGEEYEEKVAAVAERCRKWFDKLVIGRPLLGSVNDHALLLGALQAEFDSLAPDEYLLLVGHGSAKKTNQDYLQLAKLLKASKTCAMLGLLEKGCRPGLEEILPELKARCVKRVRLLPLLLVCGDHVNNDLAGAQPDSWLSRLCAAGLEVNVVKRGLGENPAVRALYLQHARDALL